MRARIFHTGNCRSENKSAFALSPFRNPLLLIGAIAAQLIPIGALNVPWLSSVLQVQPVTFEQWMQLAMVAMAILIAIELHKLHGYKFRTKRRR